MKYIRVLIFFLSALISSNIYASPKQVFIVFSGEELGNLEPCGCYEGQIGGISRRYTFLKSLSDTKEKNIIFPVSLGDLVSGGGRQEEIKMETLCRAMAEMDYIVHNLGEKDIEIGLQLISYLSQTGNVAFLASNIKINTSLPIRVNQYILKEYSNSGYSFKIAFLGIISHSLLKDYSLDSINICDPILALKPLIKKLKNKANLIVLLSHASREESVEIARLFPEIGLIITGHDTDEPGSSMVYVNNVSVITAGKEGKYVGIAKYLAGNKALEMKSLEIIPLDHKYKDSSEMVTLLKEYQQILKDEDILSKVPQAPLPEGISYVGSSVCGMCHKIVYDHWNKTGHGGSYTTLVSGGHQYDPECIKCHTVGYGDTSGFLNYESNPNLIHVGCESCHGAGSNHIKNVKDKSYGFVDENTCKVCHDIKHSPKFQFNQFWEKIHHPKEVLTNLHEAAE